MNSIEIVVESIHKIDEMLKEPDLTESRVEALMRVKSRYLGYLDILNCGCDVKLYVAMTDEELRKMREKILKK